MKNLKEYIKESILGDWNDVNADEISEKHQRTEVEDFLKENYRGKFEISEKPNSDGKFEVFCKSGVRAAKEMVKLTNEYFIFTEVRGLFEIADNTLITLEGAPRKVGGFFNCEDNVNLTSLEGAPKEVGGDFYCEGCGTQFTEDDVKKVSKVKGTIYV